MIADILAIVAPPFEAYLSGPWLYGALVLLGGFFGILTGLFGVGGGFAAVPLMNTLLGIPYEIAVGSSLSMIVGTSTTGILKNRRQGTANLAIAGTIASGSAVGAILGDMIQTALVTGMGGGHGSRFTLIMHALFITLLAVAFALTLHKPNRGTHRPLLQRIPCRFCIELGSGSAGPSGPEPAAGSATARAGHKPAGTTAIGVFWLVLLGIGIGILTGLLGIGGGVLMIPLLLVVVGLGERESAGTSLGIVFVSALVGTLKKAYSPIAKVSLPVTVALLLAGVIGVQIGIALGHHVDGRRFRKWYSFIILAAVAIIIVDVIGILLA